METIDDPRWAMVEARNIAADGSFYYSVRTTGIYCRPSCSAKLARPENVRFHASCEEAEKAGFRPCKRCRPQELASNRNVSIVAQACRIIEKTENNLPLKELAKQVGLSVYHFHRLFKQATGLTPRSYASARRSQRLQDGLSIAASVTEAIYNAGYASSSRFYEASDQLIGMTPTAYRSGGKGMNIHFAVTKCRLGSVLVAQTERGICAILMGDSPQALVEDLENRFPNAHLAGGDAGFEETVAKVIQFIEAPGIDLDLPLDVRGTVFQQRVWQALREIPPGQTRSYTEIARQIGAPASVRAVASACAANALAVAIPCHRVLRNDGKLSGYRWGIERKRALLEIESVMNKVPVKPDGPDEKQ